MRKEERETDSPSSFLLLLSAECKCCFPLLLCPPFSILLGFFSLGWKKVLALPLLYLVDLQKSCWHTVSCQRPLLILQLSKELKKEEFVHHNKRRREELQPPPALRLVKVLL